MRDRRGIAAVEMAAIAPLFISLIMGVLMVSQLGMTCQLLTTAAREGCRAAVVPNAAASDVQAAVNRMLAGSNITIGTVTPTCPGSTPWTSATKGTPITLSLSVPFQQISWLPTGDWFNVTLSGSATLACERP
jgi:Flp pilus assembly protein TadG